MKKIQENFLYLLAGSLALIPAILSYYFGSPNSASVWLPLMLLSLILASTIIVIVDWLAKETRKDLYHALHATYEPLSVKIGKFITALSVKNQRELIKFASSVTYSSDGDLRSLLKGKIEEGKVWEAEYARMVLQRRLGGNFENMFKEKFDSLDPPKLGVTIGWTLVVFGDDLEKMRTMAKFILVKVGQYSGKQQYPEKMTEVLKMIATELENASWEKSIGKSREKLFALLYEEALVSVAA